MVIYVIDTGFYKSIIHKYHRFRYSQRKFPSLIFLFRPQNPILHYLLLKNMNVLPGNRNYQLHIHQHRYDQQVRFVINLFLRLSPHFFGFTSNFNSARFRASNLSHVLKSIILSPEQEEQKGESKPVVEKSQRVTDQSLTTSEYTYPTFLQNSKVSNMFIHTYQRLIHNIHFPKATDFYHFYQKLTPTAEKQQPVTDQSLTTSEYTYPTFLQNSKVSNMFIHAYQRLIHRFHFPGESRTVYPPHIYPAEFVLPVSKFFPSKWGKDKEDSRGKRMTEFSKSSKDLHYLNPLKRIENDLEKTFTLNNMNGMDGVNGVSGVNGVNDHKDTSGVRGMETVKPAIDLDQLTNQVYRRLERTIRIEKERRGW